MDFRDRSIITQVAFKAAVDLSSDLDITDPAGQARFEETFSYLQTSLFHAIKTEAQDPGERAGELIRGAFPGTVQVPQQTQGGADVHWHPSQGAPQQQPAYANGGGSWGDGGSAGNVQTMQDPYQAAQPQQQPGGLRIKGNQFGPIPDWLFQMAAEKGVTEVYDNRDRAAGTKRPWFRATTGGENAPAFWPPR